MFFQKVREWLILFLITLLPFHAFLVTVGTWFLVGPGYAPLLGLASWKEFLLAGVLVIAILEICYSLRVTRYALRVDILDWLIIGLFVLGMVTTNYKLLTTNSLFGAKYTLFPLFLFFLLRRVSWSERFTLLVTRYSLLVGVVVAAHGMLTLLLPQTFFTWLGYSDLHSTYLPDGPLAAFQYLEGTGIRRMQATFAGPNQLGMWLLIPFSVAVASLVRRRVTGYWLLVTGFLGVALVLTFSRAVWIGAVVIFLVALWHRFSRCARYWLLFTGFSFLAVLVVLGAITRPQSTAEHFRRPLQALQIMARNPLGLGLGAAGPAANRTGDPCVYFEEGADVSWAADRPGLCVFVGGRQVQPFDSAQGKPLPCQCPLLPENWYLQVGVELGVLGLVLYLVFVGVMGYELWGMSIFHAFVGISVAALFLHAWEDSAVAYTVWMLIAAALPPLSRRHAFFPTFRFPG